MWCWVGNGRTFAPVGTVCRHRRGRREVWSRYRRRLYTQLASARRLSRVVGGTASRRSSAPQNCAPVEPHPETHTSSDVERFQQAQDYGFNSLLFLAQALAGQPSLDDVQLWAVSNHTQKVESADVVYPEKATILGLCKVIQQENAEVTCHYIDLALPETAAQSNDSSRNLLAEIGT